ncbi:MAG: hypothetical protein RI973_509 [Bacteroidota bacterium]|jgi:hypothetical protein
MLGAAPGALFKEGRCAPGGFLHNLVRSASKHLGNKEVCPVGSRGDRQG